MFFSHFSITNQLPGFSISRLANVEGFLMYIYTLKVILNVTFKFIKYIKYIKFLMFIYIYIHIKGYIYIKAILNVDIM